MDAVADEDLDVAEASDPAPARGTKDRSPQPPKPTAVAAPRLERDLKLIWTVVGVFGTLATVLAGFAWNAFLAVTDRYVKTREDIVQATGALSAVATRLDETNKRLEDIGKRLDRLEDRVNKAGIPTSPVVDGGVADAEASAVFATVTARCDHATIKVNKWDQALLDGGLPSASAICIEAGKRHAQVFDTKNKFEYAAKKNELAGQNLTWTAQADPTVTCSCTQRVD